MLTKFDEYPCHQLVSTFDHPASGDRRWFDRYWLALFDHAGQVAIAFGLGMYLNTNVLDGYGSVLYEGKQYNVRLSRVLRPDLDIIGLGPLHYDIIEGLRKIRLRLDENESGISFDVTWEGTGPPWEEAPHFSRRDGRIMSDFLRYDQNGTGYGIIKVGDKRIELRKETTYGSREHAWGISPGVGWPEQETQQPGPNRPGLFTWLTFAFDGWEGYYQATESQDGSLEFFDGGIWHPYGGERRPRRLTKVEHKLCFLEGSRRVKDGELFLRDEMGTEYQLSLRSIAPPLNFQGWGYGDGFNDRLGIGVYRGPLHVEVDVWDVSDPTKCVNLTPGGYQPQNRIWDNLVEIRKGSKIGYGYYPVYPRGAYDPYGFSD